MIVLFNILVTLALTRKAVQGLHSERQINIGLMAGTKAPYFTARTIEGKKVSLDDFVGRKVIFLFISPYCAPCKERLNKVQALESQALVAGIQLVLVSTLGTVEEILGLVNEFKLTLPLLLDTEEEHAFFKAYNITGTPSYCMVVNGIVVSSGYPLFLDTGGEWDKLTSINTI